MTGIVLPQASHDQTTRQSGVLDLAALCIAWLGGYISSRNELPPAPRLCGVVFLVRPALAHSCGCKSRHELVATNEAKRNSMRATECGEEAWSVDREPMGKKLREGAAEQGERAKNREALVTKAKWRKCSGSAMKECVLT